MTGRRDTNDTPTVVAPTKNTGGRALDLNGQLWLSHGPGGLSAGPFPVTLGTTLGIGQTEPVAVSLGAKIPDGPWHVTVTMKSGLTTRTAHATLTFPSGPGVGRAVRACDGLTTFTAATEFVSTFLGAALNQSAAGKRWVAAESAWQS